MNKPIKIVMGALGAFLLLISLIIIPKLSEEVDAGEVVIIQDAWDGDLHVYKNPGYVGQWLGKATHYRKSNQFWFSKKSKEDEEELSIPVKWNDGGHASISGSVRYDLPMDDSKLIAIHSTFGSQEAIERQLIKTNIEKAVFFSGPLMTSKESYAEKRNDLIYYIEDQASRGVYKTVQEDVKELDPFTNQEKNVTRVKILIEKNGLAKRQEASPIFQYGLRLYNISINSIDYDKNVEAQIQTQQNATMQVQTAIANAKKAEQEALTIAKQGEADAAKAKWEQEIIKARVVTEAEQKKKVAELEVQTAELNKRKAILEGEGEAAKKRAIMQANGALEQKLDVYLQTQLAWAKAFGEYRGNVMPYIIGGTGSAPKNSAFGFMDIISAKAAMDLSLNMNNLK